MEYLISVQETGQSFPVEEEIGKDDLIVRRALNGVIPYIEAARIERKVEGETTTITITKSHAPKGSKGGGATPLPFVKE